MIGVLIVGDHPARRAGLADALSACRDLRVVACASSGREGVRLAVAHDPDVVLMQLEHSDLDGTSATREILAADPTARVLVLSGNCAPTVTGAIGHLAGDTAPEELVRAVRAVAAGDAPGR